jgi:chemotaxis methyl-accepting protein methylase
MLSLSPSLADGDARKYLDLLVDPSRSAGLCCGDIRRLTKRFQIYTSTCPEPLPSTGLIITPEIRRQCEIYLPLDEIVSAFHRLFQDVLSYPPIFESTPFYTAMSWADVFAALPPRFQFSANPAILLERLCDDHNLLTEFMFAVFLPRRFYGGFRRYPHQREFVRSWICGRTEKTLRCLDAACGTGEDSYGLAQLLLELGCQSAEFRIEGWTIEPLEVWAAAHACFPHDPEREVVYRRETGLIFEHNAADRILFRSVDLRDAAVLSASSFDLILCNGLLGGPILHKPEEVKDVVTGLVEMLELGGMLLAADSFHGGWRQKYPQDWLRAQFESIGLRVCTAGEGICASR